MPRFCGSCNRDIHDPEFHVDMGVMGGRACLLIAVEDVKKLDGEVEIVDAEVAVPRTKKNNRRWVQPARVPHLA